MRQLATASLHACNPHEPGGVVIAMKSINGRNADRGEPAEPAPLSYRGYTDQPLDWRTRLMGLCGTASVFLAIAAVSFITWQVVLPMAAPQPLTVMNLPSDEAPPEPVHDVPDGEKQVQQDMQTPREDVERPPLPDVVIPRETALTLPSEPPVKPVPAQEAVTESTAPQSVVAPPSNRAAASAVATWQTLLLAHLEKHRRYPDRARKAGHQGVTYVSFRMNRQGQVLSSSILRSSGYSALDQAALETLRRAQPLPPIPDDQPDMVELTVPVEFFTR